MLLLKSLLNNMISLLTYFLDQLKINFRLLVASNLSNQYVFQDFKYRLSSVLVKTEVVINQTLWLRNLPYFG